MKQSSRFGYRQLPLWLASIGLMLVLAACQAAATPPAPTEVPTTAPVPVTAPTTAPTSAPASTSSEATINVATDPKYGKILVDGNGMTLYMFTNDKPDVSNCSAGCLKAWPALKTQGSPVVGTGVDASMVGNTTMADGSKIVTYNHMPLYTWMKDKKPGDITGLGVGSVWFMVSPDGKVVGMDSQASPTAAPTKVY
jgi:predicted lipoprotein with Yx(FWY)xxD motif